MNVPVKRLRFVWWNAQDCAHYDPRCARRKRWPDVPGAWNAKRERVEAVLKGLNGAIPPQLLAFAEMTDAAAHELQERLYPGYRVHLVGSLREDDLRVAVLYDPAAGFDVATEDFLLVKDTPESTREMPFLEHFSDGNRIRFVACHWTAPVAGTGRKWRRFAAQEVATMAYDFLRPATPSGERKHLVVFGDLNAEPFDEETLEESLNSSRAHDRARRHHPRDAPVRRVRLYNCSWRLLGEGFAHPHSPNHREAAGTYYSRKRRTWHTLDQVVVSRTLLTRTPPFLDEWDLRVVCGRDEFPDDLLGADGFPMKFAWNNGKPGGVSDHLPISGSIVLS